MDTTMDPQSWPGDTRPLWQRALDSRQTLALVYGRQIRQIRSQGLRRIREETPVSEQRLWQSRGGRTRSTQPDFAALIARNQATGRFTSEAARSASYARCKPQKPGSELWLRRVARGNCGECGRPRGLSGTTQRCATCQGKQRVSRAA